MLAMVIVAVFVKAIVAGAGPWAVVPWIAFCLFIARKLDQ